MRTFFLIAFCMILIGVSTAFCQSWQWVQSGGGKWIEDGTGISTDNQGNIYITGYFSDSSIFGGFTMVASCPISCNNSFVIKYASTGDVLWVKQMNAVNWGDEIYAYAISTDDNGNSYVTGKFEGQIKLDTFTLTNITTNDFNIFVAKYDKNGNVLWAKSAGGPSYYKSDAGTTVWVDNQGNCYVAGYYESANSVIFDNDTLPDSYGATTGFLAKYDNNGNVLWVKATTGTYTSRVNSISIDNNGNSYVTGYFWDKLTLDTIVMDVWNGAMFIAKYDANGNVIWAKAIGGVDSYNDEGVSLENDASGNFYLTGMIGGTEDFMGTSISGIFISKFANNGNLLWVKPIVNLYNYNVKALCIDGTGNSYVNIRDDVSGTGSMFVSAYNANGDSLWKIDAQSNDFIFSNDIDYDSTTKSFYLIGQYLDTAYFGNNILYNRGSRDVFLTRLSDKAIPSLFNSLVFSEKNQISIYPNPFSINTELRIQEEESDNNYDLQLTIYNLLGEAVQKTVIPGRGRKLIIERAGLPDGIYFYKVTNKVQTIGSGKLVIQ